VLEAKRIYDAFTARGVGFWTGVPDSLLKDFCAYITDHAEPARHVIAANEGAAVGMAAGYYLAAGEPAAVYLQNSGLGNAINPLTSLADPQVYGIPMLVLIGWRGEPGKPDEPQHVKMGSLTLPVLDTLGLRHAILPSDDAAAVKAVEHAVDTTMAQQAPFCLIVPQGTFARYTLQNVVEDTYSMSREQALRIVLDEFGSQAFVVSTTGKPSRELYELREQRGETHDSDFLVVGSMGHCSQIALGIAMRRPETEVLCIDGDGAVLMHMGGLAIVGSVAPRNFRHILLNNAAHDSVGGQPTVGYQVDFCQIARACGYRTVVRAEDEASLRAGLNEVRGADGPALMEIRVRKGSRKDLGRPAGAPVDNRCRFMEYVRNHGS
jgi:phosphonopyruvate decarboxylase